MMKISNSIEMPWEQDLSVNHMRFGAQGGYRKKPHVQAWMRVLAWIVRLRANEGRPLIVTAAPECSVPVTVTVDFRFPDDRRRDDHNYYKVICDAVAEGLNIDDRDIRIRTGTITVDRERPGFTITLTDEEG